MISAAGYLVAQKCHGIPLFDIGLGTLALRQELYF